MQVIEHVETPRGSLRVVRHRVGLLASVAAGYLEVEVAHALIRIGDAEIARSTGAFVHFLDWRGVTGYASAGRRLCTEWAMKQRPPYPELHIVTRHRLVNMGVAAAGMALAVAGRGLQGYSSHETYKAALERLVGGRES